MQKVMIIGSPGAGKSTFARKLRDSTGLPLYHLDMIWHKPDGSTVSKELFDRRLSDITQNDTWIIDGNYQRTLEMRLQACDTVFLMDYPLEVCLAGAAARIGKKREDLPWVETSFDEEFKQFILHFPEVQLPLIYEKLEQYKNSRQIYIFRSREEADEYLHSLDEMGTDDFPFCRNFFWKCIDKVPKKHV